MTSTVATAFVRMIPILILLAIWQVMYPLDLVNAELVPAPTSILAALIDLGAQPAIYINLGASLLTASVGLGVGIVLGVPLGMGMALSTTLDGFFGPIVKATYSIPKSAIIPLLVLFFGVGGMTNVLATMLTCLLPILIYTQHGIRSVPQKLVWSARSMGAGRVRELASVHFMAALPQILTGIRIALGLTFIITLAAEMIVSNRGIGLMIFHFGDSGAYPYMFAAITAIMLVAFAADRAFVALTDWLLRWQDGEPAHG